MRRKDVYFEYNYVKKARLPYYSLNAYWPLWIGIASKGPGQACRGTFAPVRQALRAYLHR